MSNLESIPPTFNKCADQHKKCISNGVVYYGKNNKYVKKYKNGIIACTNDEFKMERDKAIENNPNDKNFIEENGNDCFTGDNIKKCANEGEICKSEGKVYFGANGNYIKRFVTGLVKCDKNNFMVNNTSNMLAADGKIYFFAATPTTTSVIDPAPNTTKACYTANVDNNDININQDTLTSVKYIVDDYDRLAKELEEKKKEIIQKAAEASSSLIDANAIKTDRDRLLIENATLKDVTLKNTQDSLEKCNIDFAKEKTELENRINTLNSQIITQQIDYEQRLINKENEKINMINQYQKDLGDLRNTFITQQNELEKNLQQKKQESIDKITELFSRRENEYLVALGTIQQKIQNLAEEEANRQAELIKQLEDQKADTKKKLKELYDDREEYFTKIINSIIEENNNTLESLKNENKRRIDALNAGHEVQLRNIENQKDELNNAFNNFKKMSDNNIEELRKQYNEMVTMYEARIKELEDKINKLIDDFNADIQQMGDIFKNEVDKLITDRNATATQVKTETAQKIESYLNKYNEQRETAESVFKQTMNTKKQDFENELNKQKNEYTQKINDLQSKNEQLISDLNKINEETKTVLITNQQNIIIKIDENKENLNKLMVDYEKKKQEMEKRFMDNIEALENKKIEIVKKKQQETMDAINKLGNDVDTIRTDVESKKTKYDKELKDLIISLENEKINMIREHNNKVNSGIDDLTKKYNNEKEKIQDNINKMTKDLNTLKADFDARNIDYNNMNKNYLSKKIELDAKQMKINREQRKNKIIRIIMIIALVLFTSILIFIIGLFIYYKKYHKLPNFIEKILGVFKKKSINNVDHLTVESNNK